MKRLLASVLPLVALCCALVGCDAPRANPNCFDCAGSNACFLCGGSGFNYVSSHDYRRNVICVSCKGSGLCSQCCNIDAAIKICPLCKGAGRCGICAGSPNPYLPTCAGCRNTGGCLNCGASGLVQ